MYNILFGQINVLSMAECRIPERKTIEKLVFTLGKGGGRDIVSELYKPHLSIARTRRSLIVLIARNVDPERLNIRSPAVRGDKSLIGSSIKIPAAAVKFTREKEITYRIR